MTDQTVTCPGCGLWFAPDTHIGPAAIGPVSNVTLLSGPGDSVWVQMLAADPERARRVVAELARGETTK